MIEPSSDPRVRQVSDYHFIVVGSSDKFDVTASEQSLGEWLAYPALDSPSTRAADLRSRADAQAWAERTTTRHRSLSEALTYALTRVGAP